MIVAGVAGSLSGAPVVIPRGGEVAYNREFRIAQATKDLDILRVSLGSAVSSTPLGVPPAAHETLDVSAEGDGLVAKVAELRSLADGALGPGSRRVPEDVLAHLLELGSLPSTAHAVPTFDGAVSIGWRRGDVEFTAEIQAGDRLFLCVDNTVTDDLRETETSFDVRILERFLATGAWDQE